MNMIQVAPPLLRRRIAAVHHLCSCADDTLLSEQLSGHSLLCQSTETASQYHLIHIETDAVTETL